MNKRVFSVFLFLFAVSTSCVFAQESRGTILGRVTMRPER